MAKRSRGRVSREPAPAAARPQRTTRRRPVRRQAEQPFFERYRGLLNGGLALAGVLIIGFLFLQGATRAAYDCRSQLTPGPSEPAPTPRPSTPAPTVSPSASSSVSPSTGSPSPSSGSPPPSVSPSPSESASPSSSESPSPSPSPSPTAEPSPTARLGFTTSDLGAFHVVDPNTTIRYDFCPPASGPHYNLAGVAPMPPAVYPPAQERAPGFWVHNLEHGYAVALYRCPSGQLGVGDCITRDQMAQLEAWFNEAPAPTVSTCPKKVMVARFDDMSTNFALLGWDRALLTDPLDLDTALLFAEQWMEHDAAPENNSC